MDIVSINLLICIDNLKCPEASEDKLFYLITIV